MMGQGEKNRIWKDDFAAYGSLFGEHPVCPQCGAYMLLLTEKYDLNTPFEDKWFECPACGYCREY